jgi:hypothetical protein
MVGSWRSSLDRGEPEGFTDAERASPRARNCRALDSARAGNRAAARRLLRGGAWCLLLFGVAPAAAGAATIQLKPSAPPDAQVGAVWPVEILVTRDPGEAPAGTAIITLANETTGERLDVTAQQTSDDVYKANVVFPTPGNWRYSVVSGNAGLVSDPIRIGSAESAGSTWMVVALVAFAIAIVALVALFLTRRRPRLSASEAQPPSPEPLRPAPASQPPVRDETRNDRDALIRSCVYLYDIVREPVLRDRLREALAEAGVSELDNVGGRFDPVKHIATGRVPTDNPSLDGQIADVERPGFSDRGRVLRLPEVTVYSATGRESSG